MAPLGGMFRQLLAYLAQHPQTSKFVKSSSQKIQQSPAFKNAKNASKNFTDKSKSKLNDFSNKFEGGTNGGKGSSGKNGTGSSSSFWEKASHFWLNNKAGFISFVGTNFLGFLILLSVGFEFLKAFAGGLMNAVTLSKGSGEIDTKYKDKILAAVGDENDEAEIKDGPVMSDRQRERAEKRERKREAKRASKDREVLSHTDYVSSTEQNLTEVSTGDPSSHDPNNPFDTRNWVSDDKDRFSETDFTSSFVVKMDDEKEFTSSLDRENVVGAKCSSSTW